MQEDEMAHGEIIIVRRSSGGHEDEHHGGVWKIAFADFMTAMMAFFLVMWLINASNEETKKAVASYFNPIKLMDTTTNPKGVRNPKYGTPIEDDVEPEENTTVTTTAKSAIANKLEGKTFDEQALFVDPFAILSEIAGGTSESEIKDEAAPGSSNSSGLSGGVAFEDPFDPSSWSMKYGQPEDPSDSAVIEDTTSETTSNKSSGSLQVEDEEFEYPATSDLATEDTEAEKPAPVPEVPVVENVAELPPEKPELQPDPMDGETEKLTEAIRDEIAKSIELENMVALKLEVTSTGEGTLITLADQSQTGMFAVGSARPTPELVNVTAKIGEIVSQAEGLVTISGHTDGRPYQSGDYDNWRLSTARAHMAYYMLMRGGMSEKRVEKIEGHADVRLKMPKDPFDPVNRRIEILLRLP